MLEERALLGRRQQPRREARLVEESPEIVAGVREVRTRGSRDAGLMILQKTAARPARARPERRSRRSALQRTLKRSARGRGRQGDSSSRSRSTARGRWRPRTTRRTSCRPNGRPSTLLAALVRCSLTSSATTRRLGADAAGPTSERLSRGATRTAGTRSSEGRGATRARGGAGSRRGRVGALLAKAERDCFVAASSTARRSVTHGRSTASTPRPTARPNGHAGRPRRCSAPAR